MFTSVLSSLKTQSEKLKDTIHTNVVQLRNSEQIQDLSFTKLKSNVIEKSVWIQSSVSQKLQPYLLNNNSTSDTFHIPPTKVPDNYLESKPTLYKNNYTEVSYNNSSQRSLSSYFRPKVHINPQSNSGRAGSSSSKRHSRKLPKDDPNNPNPKCVQNYRKRVTRTSPQNQNVNKTWIEMDLKNNLGRRDCNKLLLGNEDPDSSSSSETEDEEDITDKFARVTMGLAQPIFSTNNVIFSS